MNLVDFSVTPPHIAFEEVKREAASLGIEVTGSEIVGLVPKEALLKAGRFYAPAETQEDSLIRVAMDHLGLGDLEPFDAGKKVIEYQL